MTSPDVVAAWSASVQEVLGPGSAVEPDDAGPVVALVGAYNSAKTTLLKRLAIDDGIDVPAWARVSAREETAEVNHLVLHGCLLVDTPGLDALSEWHAEATRGALCRADAVLLLTTSSLFSLEDTRDNGASRLRPLDVLTGHAFGADGLTLPTDALKLVITRIDEAGADPEDAPRAFAELRKRKTEELLQLVRRVRPEDVDDTCVTTVAADPGGRAGDRHVTRDYFDPGREWDGVRELVDWLGGVRSRATELRMWRDMRIGVARLASHAMVLTEASRDAVLASAQVAAAFSSSDELVERVSRERSAIEQRLHAAADAALYEAPPPSAPDFEQDLRRLLAEQLNIWAEQTSATLGELARQLEVTLPDVVTDAERASAHIVDAVTAGPDWQQQARRARSVVGVVRKVMAELAPAEGQPAVKSPGGLRLPGLPVDHLKGFDGLLQVASVMLAAADELAQASTPTRADYRRRLDLEVEAIARQMFLTRASPDGWQGLFDQLSQAATSMRQTAGEAADAAARVAQVSQSDLLNVEELLRAQPRP